LTAEILGQALSLERSALRFGAAWPPVFANLVNLV
jgi:hypothetical protein